MLQVYYIELKSHRIGPKIIEETYSMYLLFHYDLYVIKIELIKYQTLLASRAMDSLVSRPDVSAAGRGVTDWYQSRGYRELGY